MHWLLVIPVVWLFGTFFYIVTIYNPIVTLFRSVMSRQHIMKRIKRRHSIQAVLWPFYIHRIPAWLKEAKNATRSMKKP